MISSSMSYSFIQNDNGVFRGTPGNDIGIGTNGNDLFQANAGNDILFGRGGDDRIFAGGGDDLVFGGRGNDFIEGANGDDWLFGGRGEDRIEGGMGDDVIFGGKGNDVLNGGEGADIFVFNRRSGDDVVEDFTAGEDMLFFGCWGRVEAEQVGDDTVITFGRSTVTLVDVDLETIADELPLF